MDVVGDGVMRSRLEALARRVGIEDRVRFHGAVSYDDLPYFYRQAQFLIVTSRYEAFGVEAVEALASGLGVIGTDVGIIPEIGAVVPVGDIVEFQKMILSRTRHQTWDQRLRYRMAAEYDYSLPRLSERLWAVYAELLPGVPTD
jgi:glycosyltransferase involved in cell wall biosynthesis